MNNLKAKTMFLGIVSCYLFLCLTGPILVAENVGTAEMPIFEPGKEYHVVTDNEAIGTKSFNVYVPVDYTEDCNWPVIFRYKGRGDKYNPIICRGGRMITCDRGAIIVGMGYLEAGKNKIKAAEFIDYVGRELKSIYEAKELISKHLKVDNDRLFISGSSAGGWLASLLLEYRAQFWAGALIFVAGRHRTASLLTNEYSVRAFEGMPVFFGASLPGSSHGVNYKWARAGQRLYKQRGAIVSFEIYPKTGWLVCSPLLRDWTRAYILGNKTDSIREKTIKWKQLNRTKLKNIDSTEIIKKQIAKQLNKQADQLTQDDLIEIKELSLMGENISDIAYISNLINLESLDISFTHTENIEPLLNCKSLKKLNISGTRIKNIVPLKILPQLDSVSMWNLWLDRSQVNELKQKLPDLKIIDYQWDLYERDSIGRVLPKLRIKLN
ncbi:MAG: prolyl oligopeptidase family serine peptidase [Planctomycetes bacterium]|nr:prolyl oligopeptidase family serine peptidase [Planctomycetota bacterium]